MKDIIVPKKADENLINALAALSQALDHPGNSDRADADYDAWREKTLNPIAKVSEFLNKLDLSGQAAEITARLDGMVQLCNRYFNLLNIKQIEQYQPEKLRNYANSLLGRDGTIGMRKALKDFLEITGNKYIDIPEVKELYTMIGQIDKASSTLETLAIREISSQNTEIDQELDEMSERIRKFNEEADTFTADAEKNRVNINDPKFIDKMIIQAEKKISELNAAAVQAQRKYDDEMKEHRDLSEKLSAQDKMLETAENDQKKAEAALNEAQNRKQELLKEINALKLEQVQRPEKMKKLVQEYNDGIRERREAIREIESKYTQKVINEADYLHGCADTARSYTAVFDRDNGPGKPPTISINDAKTLKRIVLNEISPSQAEFEGPGPRMEKWLAVFDAYKQLCSVRGNETADEDSPEEEIAFLLDRHAASLDVYENSSDLKMKYAAPDFRDVMRTKFDQLSIELDYSIRKMGPDLLHRYYEEEDIEEFKAEMMQKIETLQDEINVPPERNQEYKLTEELMKADETVKFASIHLKNMEENRDTAKARVDQTRAEMRDILDGTRVLKASEDKNAITSMLREFHESKKTLEALRTRRTALETSRSQLTKDIQQLSGKIAERQYTDVRAENIKDDVQDLISRMNFSIEGHSNSKAFIDMANALEGVRSTLQGVKDNVYEKADVLLELGYLSEKAAAYREAKASQFFKKGSAMRHERLNFARELKNWADAMKEAYAEEVKLKIDPEKVALVSEETVRPLQGAPKEAEQVVKEKNISIRQKPLQTAPPEKKQQIPGLH